MDCLGVIDLLLGIIDGLPVQVPAEHIMEAARILKHCMETAVELRLVS